MLLNYRHLTGPFAQSSDRGRGYVVKLWSEIGSGGIYNLIRAIFASQNHFYSKWVYEISGWRFLKFWFFYAGFYCIQFLHRIDKVFSIAGLW